MGVDYYSCNSCGDTFGDVGTYISCVCERKWCNDECAKEDGYIKEHCNTDNCTSLNGCWGCENNIQRSCRYCREEDFDDSILLEFVLKLLEKTRDEVIEDYKESLKTLNDLE